MNKYRFDIDGLRAVAVMSVVLFHFGVPGFSGGFVGVDVFFVISGYLISQTIYTELAAGNFSIVSFYERRARRILPAFFVVSTVSGIAAYYLLLPQGFDAFARSLFASSLFAGNVFFYASTDYFGAQANQLPLLHYWSLGVEEQFYIFFPLVAAAAFRWRKRALPIVLLALFAASLIASQMELSQDPAAAFYLLHFRAFELLLGCILALPQIPHSPNKGMASAAGIVGMTMIGLSVAVINDQMAFPGVLALVPCTGAALVLWGGACTNTASRALGNAAMAFVGRISYSLYLIHWPVVVFMPLAFPGVDPKAGAAWGIAASLGLAFLSYRFIEQPVRIRRFFWTRRVVLTSSVASLAVLMGAGAEVAANAGYPGRVDAAVSRIAAYVQYDPTQIFNNGTCFQTPEQDPVDFPAVDCLPTGQRVVLWGDSHLAQYQLGLAGRFRDAGYAMGQITSSGCPPTAHVYFPHRPKCEAFNDYALAKLKEIKPTLVVMSGVWLGSDMQFDELDRTIQELKDAGIAALVLGPSVIFKKPIPYLLIDRLKAGDPSLMGDADMESVVFDRDEAMAQHFRASRLAPYISVLDLVCPQRNCPLSEGGIPLHFDIAHVTREGAEHYGQILAPAILRALHGGGTGS